MAAAAGSGDGTVASASDATHFIETPVSSPAFAAAAGYRIAVMVQGGVESAQLQLNPAGMGPVTVQIVVDGQTAQVHLAAEQFDTRQALEACLPQLASQLRESGFTLTGGGVFEQPARQQQPAPESGNGSGNGSGNRQQSPDDSRSDNSLGAAAPWGSEGPPAARHGSGWQPRGVVDLVA